MATSGPRLRAGFIGAPSNGPPIVPQAMMYAPTASGTNGPFSLGPLARLRIMSTRPKVMMASNPAACQDWPGLGMVAARCPAGPKNPRTSRDSQMAAANCTIQYQPAITQPMSRRSAKAKVVAGLTWAEMSPRKWTATTSHSAETSDSTSTICQGCRPRPAVPGQDGRGAGQHEGEPGHGDDLVKEPQPVVRFGPVGVAPVPPTEAISAALPT